MLKVIVKMPKDQSLVSQRSQQTDVIIRINQSEAVDALWLDAEVSHFFENLYNSIMVVLDFLYLIFPFIFYFSFRFPWPSEFSDGF